jgi:hypothetical protein
MNLYNTKTAVTSTNGTLAYTGLPENTTRSRAYIGKSNWADVTSQYANKDEMFKGALFDFRGYNVPLNAKVIAESYGWGKKMLGLELKLRERSLMCAEY